MAILSSLADSSPSFAQFVDKLQLNSLNGTNGFILNGDSKGDHTGFTVSGAGDINGDGYDDLIVAAPNVEPNPKRSGRSYVVFGRSDEFLPLLKLSTLDKNNGFKLDGEALFNYSGPICCAPATWSVSNAGDVNGDGVDDLFVGAYLGTPYGGGVGRSYIIFGQSGGFTSTLPLSSLDGTNGFKIDGSFGEAPVSLSAVGDMNGDDVDDVVIGAPRADPNGVSSGRSYILFGSSDTFADTLHLSELDGTNGFSLNGEMAGDFSGISVSDAGDINSDGIDDLIIGSMNASPNGSYSGRSYVVFGSMGGFPSSLQLSSLNGANGFKVDGEVAGDLSGRSVSGVGDVNGDGVDDFIIGSMASPNGSNSGRSYVVFGRVGEFPSSLQLSSLNGAIGFKVDGEMPGDFAGYSVSGAGDINGDGVFDLIVGAPFADPNSNFSAGRTYVLFGKLGGFPSSLQLSSLNGTNGFKIDGEAINGFSGHSVSDAGDVNNDGVDDLIIGAPGTAFKVGNIGRGYVVFGNDGIFNDGFEQTELE